MKTLTRIPVAAALAFAIVIVQLLLIRPAIERAFAGTSFSWLNAWAAGTGRSPERWLSRLDWALVGAVLVLLIPALARWLREQRWMQRRVGLASPGEIGVLRAGVCALALHQVLTESMVGLSSLGPQLRHSMGVVRVWRALPLDLQGVLASEVALRALYVATVLALVLALVGLWTRWSVAVALVLYLICGGLWRELAAFFHSGMVPLYLLGVLAFCDCGAGFSLDHCLRVRAGKAVSYRRQQFQSFAWVRWCLWLSVALPYLFAGLCKLRESGLGWTDPNNIAGILLRDSLNLPSWDFGLQPLVLELPPAMLRAAGLLTLVGELGFVLVGFSAIARFAFPALMVGMHVGTLFLQGFTFWDSLLLDAALCGLSLLWPFGVRRARHDRARRFLAFFERHLRLPASGASHGTTQGASAAVAGAPSAVFVWWVAAQFLVWALRLDVYPLTQWRMYAESRTDAKVAYWTVETRDQLGRAGGNFLKDCPRVYSRDARYRALLLFVRDSGIPAAVRDAFRVCVRNYDERVKAPDRHLATLRIQRWNWAFRGDGAGGPSAPVSDRDFLLELRPRTEANPSPARAGLDVQ